MVLCQYDKDVSAWWDGACILVHWIMASCIGGVFYLCAAPPSCCM
jgi:hypothetical protein